MTEQELYRIYYRWTGQLHQLVGNQLGLHVDVEFFPDDWLIRVYSGAAEDRVVGWFSTTPAFTRPNDEARETIRLPRPADNPSQSDLDATFRALCFAVARVLNIPLKKLGLPE